MTPAPARQAVVVGLFVTLGGVLLAAGVLAVADPSETFGRKVVVHTAFEDVQGLQVGGNVWFSGVKVGIVRDLRFGEDRQVEVDLAIDRDAAAHVPADARTRVGADALLGNKIVVLYDGEAAPPLQDGAVLEPGDVASTDDMLAMLQENNENLLSVTTSLDRIAADLAAGKGTAGRLLADETLYEDLRAGVASLGQAASSVDQLADELGAVAEQLNREGTLTTSARNLQAATERADQLLARLEQASASPSTPVGTLLHDQEAAEDLRATLENLERSSRLLAEDLEALQHSWLLRGALRKRERALAEPPSAPPSAPPGGAPSGPKDP